MKLIVNKTGVPSLVEKQTGMVSISDLLHLLSHAPNASGNLGVPIKTKLHFHQQVDTIFSQAMGLLGLIRDCDFRLFFIA